MIISLKFLYFASKGLVPEARLLRSAQKWDSDCSPCGAEFESHLEITQKREICRRWDSNSHRVAPTGFWVQRVYQFHHSGEKGIISEIVGVEQDHERGSEGPSGPIPYCNRRVTFLLRNFIGPSPLPRIKKLTCSAQSVYFGLGAKLTQSLLGNGACLRKDFHSSRGSDSQNAGMPLGACTLVTGEQSNE